MNTIVIPNQASAGMFRMTNTAVAATAVAAEPATITYFNPNTQDFFDISGGYWYAGGLDPNVSDIPVWDGVSAVVTLTPKALDPNIIFLSLDINGGVNGALVNLVSVANLSNPINGQRQWVGCPDNTFQIFNFYVYPEPWVLQLDPRICTLPYLKFAWITYLKASSNIVMQ